MYTLENDPMAKRQKMAYTKESTDPIALYVHWPWCRSKCPYCDFNSHAVDGANGEVADTKAWTAAYLAELEHFAAITGPRHLVSLFFGGGTPSLMSPDTVAAVIERAGQLWPRNNSKTPPEITLEANPTSVEAETFPRFRDAGVNRVSVGVQAFDDAALAFLGREHSAFEARAALERAAATFARWNFDLIYARPGQTPAAWGAELGEALALGSSHLSLYQLGIEPGTAFFRNGVSAAAEDTAADLYALTQERCDDGGLGAYEVSNHARPGFESRHNLTYWQGGDYAAIGPGAHSRISVDGLTWARHQIANPARWLARVQSEGHGTAKQQQLDKKTRAEEVVLAGLRLTTGIERTTFLERTGLGLDDVLKPEAMTELVTLGLLETDAAGVRTTAAGRLVLNPIITQLLA